MLRAKMGKVQGTDQQPVEKNRDNDNLRIQGSSSGSQLVMVVPNDNRCPVTVEWVSSQRPVRRLLNHFEIMQ